jgi:putative tryptophan/tyrosine transport system substrate-binding protein
MLSRRALLLLAGAAAAGRPLAARAQQRPAMPVIGFLSSASRQLSPPGFRSGLSEAGYVLGRNLTIEGFLADGHYDRLPALANEMVRRRVNLILAAGGLPSARAAKTATSTIPILFIAGFDPVKVGLVSRFNRPGGTPPVSASTPRSFWESVLNSCASCCRAPVRLPC